MVRARQSLPAAAGTSAGDPAPPAATVLLVVTEPIRHDGRDYAPGATLELPAADAEALVAQGLAEELEASAADAGPPD